MKTDTIYIYTIYIYTYICAVKNTDRNANIKSFAIEDERLKSLAPVNQRYMYIVLIMGCIRKIPNFTCDRRIQQHWLKFLYDVTNSDIKMPYKY